MDQLLLTTIGIVLIVVLAAIAVKVGAIDVSGAATGGVITLIAFLAGGFAWLIIIVIFFALSSILTRYRFEYKNKIGSAQEKGGKRSWPNSLANAGVALIVSLGELYFHSSLLTLAFVTSIAAAMADTLATEIGVLSHSTPRLITNLRKKVASGTSGGVTLLGGLAALFAALFIAFVGLFFGLFQSGINFTIFGFVSAIIGALIGTGFDSFLGATAQSLNRCTVCGQLTESTEHHEKKTVHVKGVRFIDNNSVNFIGILVGSVAAVLIFLALSSLV